MPVRHSSSLTALCPCCLTVSAKVTSRSVASGRRFNSTSSTRSKQVLGNLFVHGQLSGVHNPHVQPGLDGVIEERRVHRFAHKVIAAKREGDVADAAADLRPRQVVLDPPGGFDEIYRVVIVFFDAGRNRQNVRIEDDVLGGNTDSLRQDVDRTRCKWLFLRSNVSA